MHSRFVKMTAVSATVTVLVAGCAADGSGLTETGQGAALGTLGGAALGAAIGSLSGDAGKGALIGAAAGAVIGTGIGAYMEQQKRDFERALAAEIGSGVIWVEKLPNDELMVRMTSATSFEVDSDRIQPGYYSTLDKIAAIVRKYDRTHLIVNGHTDSTGSAQHNQWLSERRAASVQGYLSSSGVRPQRLTAYGYGMDRPVASNAHESGRSLNRRVDLIIVPIADRS